MSNKERFPNTIVGVYIKNTATDEDKVRFIDELFKWAYEFNYTSKMELTPDSDRITVVLTK